MATRKGSKNIPNGYKALIVFTPEQREWLKANTAETVSINKLVRDAVQKMMEEE